MAASIRFGLIGLGVHGLRYAQHLQRDVPGADLVAVCQRNRIAGDQWASQHGVWYYEHYQDLVCNPMLQAVIIAAPPHVQGQMALAALNAGKAVLIEKPMTCNTQEARMLVESVLRTGLPFMVAHTLRFDGVVVKLRQLLASGMIGDLHGLTIAYRMEHPGRPWVDSTQCPGSGALLHLGTHALDLAYSLTQAEVSWIMGHVGKVGYTHREDAGMAMLYFGETLGDALPTCLLDVAAYSASRVGRIDLIGERGQLSGDFQHGTLRLYRQRLFWPIDDVPYVMTVQATLRAFVEALQTGETPPITVDDGYRAVLLARAWAMSAMSDRPVYCLAEAGEIA